MNNDNSELSLNEGQQPVSDESKELPDNTCTQPVSDEAVQPDSADESVSEDAAQAEKDILLQDLADVACPPAGNTDNEQELPPEPQFRCSRCDCAMEYEALLCEECAAKIQKYPVKLSSVIAAVFVLLFSLAGTCLLAANFNVVRYVYKGDAAYKDGNLSACYDNYSEAYTYTSALNAVLPTYEGITFFTSGQNTLAKQFLAINDLEGPYSTGSKIQQYFGENVPRSLKGVIAEYESISKTASAIEEKRNTYLQGLGQNDQPSYEKLLAIIDETESEGGHEKYILDYFRYSTAKQLERPLDECKKYLEKAISEKKDALWLFGNDAISLYRETADFDKALAICNALIEKDPTGSYPIAMSMAILRMDGDFDGALRIFDTAIDKVDSQHELARQKAVILMLRGNTKDAEALLLKYYDIETLTLVYAETMCVCFTLTKNATEYEKVVATLTKYNIELSDRVSQLASGKLTLEDIYMKGAGEVS